MIDQPKQSPIIRSQGHNPFSATRVIIETDIEARRCNNYFERIIKKDCNKSPLHNGNNFKANCDIDELSEGMIFHYLY